MFTALLSVVFEHWPKMGGGKRKLDLEKTEEEAPARKRANLDHLSPEDQLMENKLKKRDATQTARNKKKAATDSIEKQLAEAARLQESLDANIKLQKTKTKLQMENASLLQQNSDLQARRMPKKSSSKVRIWFPNCCPSSTSPPPWSSPASYLSLASCCSVSLSGGV